MKQSAISFYLSLILATIYQHSHCMHLSENLSICIRMYGSSCGDRDLTTTEKLKEYLANVGASTMDEITIENNDQLTTLQSGTFGLLRYRSLTVKTSGLSRVDDDAFQGSKDVLDYLWFKNNKFTEFNFKSLQNLTELDDFSLCNDGVESLPKDAFPSQPNIRFITLSYNNIVTLHKGTFSNLPKLIYLDLSHNKINTIGAKVFSLPNVMELRLKLKANQISSIHKNAFRDLNWRIINLDNNKLTTFDQQVFERLVDDDCEIPQEISGIFVEDNPFKCDSHILWLVRKTPLRKARIVNFRCKESGTALALLTEDDLEMNII